MRALPLYAQIADSLRAQIVDGRLRAGDRLPTESELSRLHRVSRITIREALDVLRRHGLIERFAGRGSFVARSGSVTWTINSMNDIVRLPADTETRILDWKAVAPPPDVEAFFGTGGERVYRLRAVRRRGGRPISYVEIYTLLGLGRRIDAGELGEHPVVDILERQLGIPMMSAMETVSATVADRAIARRLRVRLGAPVLIQEIQFFGIDRRPLEWVRAHWRADQFKRHTDLSRA